MASVRVIQMHDGKTDSEVYEAAKLAIPNAGFALWKTRELARLVMGTGTLDGQDVRLNVMVNFVDSSAAVTAESDGLDEAALTSITEKVHAEMAKLLA